MRNKYFRRFCEDADFNFRVTLYTGLVINIIYAVFKLVSGLYYHSEWFIATAVCYSFLILLKYTLVRHDIRFLRKGKAVDEVAGWMMAMFGSLGTDVWVTKGIAALIVAVVTYTIGSIWFCKKDLPL